MHIQFVGHSHDEQNSVLLDAAGQQDGYLAEVPQNHVLVAADPEDRLEVDPADVHQWLVHVGYDHWIADPGDIVVGDGKLEADLSGLGQQPVADVPRAVVQLGDQVNIVD